MGQVVWSEEALEWLREIHLYIAQDNPSAATRVAEGIILKAESLSQFPRSGFFYRQTSDAETRVLLYGQYRIAYSLVSTDVINILGVFHAALDMDRYLDE